MDFDNYQRKQIRFFDRVVDIRGANADPGDNMDFCYFHRLEKLSVISEDNRDFLPKHTPKLQCFFESECCEDPLEYHLTVLSRLFYLWVSQTISRGKGKDTPSARPRLLLQDQRGSCS